MITIKESFNVDIGYSDHTKGTEISIAAVALGAKVLEKHLTLDNNLPGPDHKASIEPNEFKKMVNNIRNVDEALGNGNKIPSNEEIENRKVIRKSIVAAKDIKKGDIFSATNLVAKRPGTGISPMEWDDILGEKANYDFKKDDLIKW